MQKINAKVNLFCIGQITGEKIAFGGWAVNGDSAG
jgi:hypothetical protein